MRWLWGDKDGGPLSRVRMWGFESKRFGSILLLRFEEGTREAFHTHAFNAVSWVLCGSLIEQCLAEKGPSWTPNRTTWSAYRRSWRPIRTDRRVFHRVAGGRQGAWVFTLRGPWWDGWREYDPRTGEQTKLTNGRQLRDVLPEERPELSDTGSFPLMSTICAVCRRQPSTAVVCVPGMAVSEAYCDTCLQGDAVPWDLCVANTACIGGREHCNDGWQQIIQATCHLNKKTLATFDAEVEQCMRETEAAFAAYNQETEYSDTE